MFDKMDNTGTMNTGVVLHHDASVKRMYSLVLQSANLAELYYEAEDDSPNTYK